MLLSFSHRGKTFQFDSAQPIDISIPLRSGRQNPKAFAVPDPKMMPIQSGDFIGDVLQGGSCNVNEIYFNPHCNGTHTECVGHISREKHSLNQCLQEFFFMAQLITVTPEEVNRDKVITHVSLLSKLKNELPHGAAGPEMLPANALIIRTLPNDKGKLARNYSGMNPPYLHFEMAQMLREKGVEHLLIDLPSIDKEDDSYLYAHHEYWHYAKNPLYMDVVKVRTQATVTELIYVPDSVEDGFYLLNMQVASFENDASPSKPVLYKFVS
jgi:arylformamidase